MIGTEEDARTFINSMAGDDSERKIEHLHSLLIQENALQNLVAQKSLEDAWVRHYADSAQLLNHVSRETGAWLDLGSGAGFPGMIIAILRPHQPVFLVESRSKRIEWLQRVAQELALENAEVVGARLEKVEAFDAAVISARAFAPLDKLLRLSARFSTKTTQWVLPKGRSAAQEIQELPSRWSRMFHVEQSLTSAEAGIVVGTGSIEVNT